MSVNNSIKTPSCGLSAFLFTFIMCLLLFLKYKVWFWKAPEMS